jgi:protoheme IX farnesyltransferase
MPTSPQSDPDAPLAVMANVAAVDAGTHAGSGSAAGLAPAAETTGPDARPSPLAIASELTKFRLSMLVLWTTATGAMLAAHLHGGIGGLTLLWTLLGTAMSAGAASAVNQVLEVERDRTMRRTRTRPLPAGHISRFSATMVAIILTGAGVGMLACLVNGLSAGLAALTIALYGFVYTPLKPRTTLNTFVGAVVGAIPPMIGWVAVTGRIDPGAWVLFALLFIWQVPHFLALAWMYREDYARGGFRMLPACDPDGRVTAQASFAASLLLIPVALGLTLVGAGGWIYSVGAVALGAWISVRALRFLRERTDVAARRLFLASLLYLLVVLVLAVADPTEVMQPPLVHEMTAAAR